MRQIKRHICILLCALITVSALSGCANEEKAEQERFVLEAAVCGNITSLDPAMNTDAHTETVLCALYENLMRMEDDGEGNLTLVPGVAKEYKISENVDGTVEYLFTLRSAAHWSDGSRVRARDFVYAWRRLADPNTGSPNHGVLSMLQGYNEVRDTGDVTMLGVKAEGDNMLHVTLSAPCAYFLSETCTCTAAAPLRSDAVNKDPEWQSMTGVLSNGAYCVGAWTKDEFLQLRRNTSYYNNRSSGPDVLRFRFVSSGSEAWSLYESGMVDMALDVPAQAGASGYIPLRSTAVVLYNHMSEAFSNKHVRKAFDLTLDRGAAAAAECAGAIPATGLVPGGVTGVNADGGDFRAAGGTLCAADSEGYAMRCLDAEAELRNGGYWGGVGFPAVKCLYVAGEDARAVAAAAAASWNGRLNVNVTTEGLSREEFDRRIESGDYDLAIDTLSVHAGDALDFLAPFAGSTNGGAINYGSTPYDLLIGVAKTSRDLAARYAFLHDAESLLLGDTALSPICFCAETYVLREGFEGLKRDHRGNVYFDSVSRIANDE